MNDCFLPKVQETALGRLLKHIQLASVAGIAAQLPLRRGKIDSADPMTANG
jgi:hypothetical protein